MTGKTADSSGPSKIPTQWRTVSPVPIGFMRQFSYMDRLFALIADVPGDIVECGVGEAGSFAMLAFFAGQEGRRPVRTLWGFDSFEGWPVPSPLDASPRNPEKGQWKVDREMVDRRLKESKIKEEFPDLPVRIVPGFLSKSLTNDSPFQRGGGRQIAFLHLDVDLHDSYRDALENLFHAVSVGGVIAFDEYREFPRDGIIQAGHTWDGKTEKWPGCTIAIDDFFHFRPERLRHDPNTDKWWTVKVAD